MNTSNLLDDLVAPPPWVRAERFCDIDSQAAQYRGYRQQIQQLSCGAYEGRVTSFDLGGDFVVQLETANQELAVARHRLGDRWGVCILAETSPPCILNGATLARDHLVICPEGKELFGRTPAGVHIYCMDVSRELLLEETVECNSIDVIYDAAAVQGLREVLESGLATLVRLQSSQQHSAAARAFRLSVGGALWRIISRSTMAAAQSIPQRAKGRALRRFGVAQEYIDHHLTDGISVAEVCRHSGMSWRSLERIFQSILGMGPGAYIRNLQLNRVRRDLLSGEQDGVPIGDIAARYGVWHWSRFSQNYKSLFGELPSQTRTRCASGSVAATARSGFSDRCAVGVKRAIPQDSTSHRLPVARNR